MKARFWLVTCYATLINLRAVSQRKCCNRRDTVQSQSLRHAPWQGFFSFPHYPPPSKFVVNQSLRLKKSDLTDRQSLLYITEPKQVEGLQYLQLVQIRQGRWYVRILGLEGLHHLGYGIQDLIHWVLESLLVPLNRREKQICTIYGYTDSDYRQHSP